MYIRRCGEVVPSGGAAMRWFRQACRAMHVLAYPVGFVAREGVSTVNHYGGFTRMEHESEALVTQASCDDLDAALARTVRLFIWTASKPDESSPPAGG